jgi:hypothetical protein
VEVVGESQKVIVGHMLHHLAGYIVTPLSHEMAVDRAAKSIDPFSRDMPGLFRPYRRMTVVRTMGDVLVEVKMLPEVISEPLTLDCTGNLSRLDAREMLSSMRPSLL